MLTADSKVLVVDDMSTMRRVVISFLKEMNILKVSEASSGDEAYKKILESDFTYDLIICDWTMPNGDGLALLEKVRNLGDEHLIPFIMLTAETGGDEVKAAISSGIDGYILKPVNFNTFVAKINAAIRVTDKKKRQTLENPKLANEQPSALGRVRRITHTDSDS